MIMSSLLELITRAHQMYFIGLVLPSTALLSMLYEIFSQARNSSRLTSIYVTQL
jgi:hypothetical protein